MDQLNPSYDDPPLLLSGMVRLRLDPAGRLQQFEAVPSETDSTEFTSSTSSPEPAAEPGAPLAAEDQEAQERLLFDLAGLERESFANAEPLWVPPHFCDFRRAWNGQFPGRDIPLRVEAGWLQGKVVSFQLIGPWRRPYAANVSQRSRLQRLQGVVSTILILSLLVGSVFVARKHLRTGRGDRRGATRLALFILMLHMVAWVFVANHAPSLEEEFNQFLTILAQLFFVAALFWLIYMALEPYMRRNWPDLIISWSRLLGGRLRDPLVCRDVLIGVLAGILLTLVDSLNHSLPLWLHMPPRYPERSMLFGAPSVLHSALVALEVLAGSMFSPLAIVFLLLGLRWLLRRQWLAAAVLLLAVGFVVGIQNDPSGAQSQIAIPLGILLMGMYVFVILRFGLLAVVTLAFVSNLLETSMITTDFSRWYAGNGVVTLGITLALALYGMSNAMGGRPLRRL
jgi:hypothetical protein